MYHIICRDYRRGNCVSIFFAKCLRSVYEEIELIASDFVAHYEGANNKGYFKKSKSKKWGNCPEGYFMIKTNENFIKITIMRKETILGYLSNTIIVSKIVNYQIVFIPEDEPSEESLLKCVDMEDLEFNEIEISEKNDKTSIPADPIGNKKNYWSVIHNDIRSKKVVIPLENK
jgi:hypothetical protein